MNVHHAAAAALPPGMLDTVPVRHVFNYQPAACCTINEGSYMVRVNEGMERLLGFVHCLLRAHSKDQQTTSIWYWLWSGKAVLKVSGPSHQTKESRKTYKSR